MIDQGTHIDLFSGIGGFALAARWTGFRTVAFCECEPYAQRVLRKHWPDVPIHDDVRTFPGERYAGATLLTGGFPCQPFSLAGKRAGKEDDRFLWPAMVAVIEAVRPAWIIGENVPGIVTMELDRCAADLEAQGYSVWPVIVPACAVGAFHRRDRVWIVAHNDSWCPERGSGTRPEIRSAKGSQRADDHACRPSADVANREKPGLEGPDATRPTRAAGRAAECRCDVADAEGREGDGRGAGSVASPTGRREGGDSAADAGREDVPNATRLRTQRRESGIEQTGACRWEPEPDVGRVATGIPARVDRLRGLGNAIVPQVAAEIMRMICTANAPREVRETR